MGSFQFKTGRCRHCQQPTPFFHYKLDHTAEFIMSCLTFGIWSVVWLTRSIYCRGWRCGVCRRRQ